MITPDVEHPMTWDPGWYPAGRGDGSLRWWDGHQWTAHVAVPEIRPEPPSRGRVVTLLVLAALTLVSTIALGIWGHADLERNCRNSYPDDVDACVGDASMGVDSIGAIGFIVGGVLLGFGIRGLRRRRRAGRLTSGTPAPSRVSRFARTGRAR
jgi:hypothetical protein